MGAGALLLALLLPLLATQAVSQQDVYCTIGLSGDPSRGYSSTVECSGEGEAVAPYVVAMNANKLNHTIKYTFNGASHPCLVPIDLHE